MLLILLLFLALPTRSATAQGPGFGVCKPATQRSGELGCWILTNQSVGRADGARLYWHLDSYPDSTQAQHAKGPNGVVIHALQQTWLMTIDSNRTRPTGPGKHIDDIGPLPVTRGTEYAATFMEAIMTPGMTSAVHRHSGPEAWYTIAGQTCLETPAGTVVGRAGEPAIVPEGQPMFLTATGTQQRRAIVLILHDAAKPPATMENTWKPKGLCT
jgi:quercetin dioxygenase-like cupin family protein